MNKELRELLDKINAKKSEVKNLANENKIEEAKAAKKELIDLQAKFDVLYDLEDEAKKQIEDGIENNNSNVISGIVNKGKDVANAFVNAIKAGLTRLDELRKGK